jgi:hypothetical protein
MASVKITGVAKAEAQTRKIISLGIQDENLLKDVADIIHGNIVKNARSGRDPDLRPFKELGWWAEYRHSIRKFNKTAPLYGKGVANLTYTGQLLNSFTYKINKSKAQIHFFFFGRHNPYIGKDGKAINKSMSNQDLADEVEELRPFVFFGDKAKNIVIKLVKSRIRQKLKQFNRFKNLLR